MSLRPYQLDGKVQLIQAFNNGVQAVIFCLPTGGGKTVCFSDFALDMIKAGFPTMIVCNRKELITQANKKLNQYGLYPALITPKYKDKISNIYLASIDTLRNRKFPDIKYLIIDEAHIRTFDPIVMYYKDRGVKIIGATATPIRYGKKLIKEYPDYTGQMADVYERIIEPTTISQLIKEEFLVPAITYGAPIDLSDVKKKGDDYDEKELFNKFNKPKRYAGVVEKYQQFANNLKTLVFNINVEDSLRMTQEFNSAGIPSAHVDGTTPIGERDKIFADFQRGVIQVLNNCSVATTGYDEPTIECVIVNRPTMSLSLWLQMAGRGGRICPEINKTHFILIDMGNNVFTHGFWQQEREWSLSKEYVSKKEGVAPIGNCENCDALIPLNATSCPYCSVINKKREETEKKMLEAKEAEFVLLDSTIVPAELKKPLHKMTVQELEKYRILKDYAIGWIVRQLITRGEEALREYAAVKNYSYSWVTRQMEVAQKARDEVKPLIVAFIKNNPHVSNDIIRDYAIKKLKPNHSPTEIDIAIPKILSIADGFRAGTITIEI